MLIPIVILQLTWRVADEFIDIVYKPRYVYPSKWTAVIYRKHYGSPYMHIASDDAVELRVVPKENTSILRSVQTHAFEL